MSAAFDERVETLLQGSNPSEELSALAREIFVKDSLDETSSELSILLQAVLRESVSHVVSRSVISAIADTLRGKFEDKAAPNKDIFSLGNAVLTAITARVVSFEEQVSLIRELLADVLEAMEKWKEAAQMLEGIPLNTGHTNQNNDYKLGIYLRISAYYLEDNAAYLAEPFLNRASALIPRCNDPSLELKYKVQVARIDDSKRKFLDAARRYIDLAYTSLLDDDARKFALRQAINCAVLSSAGPQRSRLLDVLYKDERTKDLSSHPILAAMYFGRIVRKGDLEAFAKLLAPHQKALTADNTTILDRAVVQHNMLAISSTYTSISFEELAILLQVSPEKAESIAATMMAEGRLQGSIDQLDGFVEFSVGEAAVTQRDRQIEGLCNHLTVVADMVVKATATTSRASGNIRGDNH